MKMLIIASSLISLLTFCNIMPKASIVNAKANMDTTENITTKKGIIMLSNLNIDYFFPTDQAIEKRNYSSLDYGNGFLLLNLGAQERYNLMKTPGTGQIDSFNYPIIKIVPVSIKYYEKEKSEKTELKQLCVKLADTVNCLNFDTKFRFFKEVKLIE